MVDTPLGVSGSRDERIVAPAFECKSGDAKGFVYYFAVYSGFARFDDNVKNTLEKCSGTAMIVRSVAYTTFRPKGNNNSRSKCAFKVKTILLGGKPS